MLEKLILWGVTWGLISADSVHSFLLRGPQTKPYAEVISTEELSAVLSTAVDTLPSTDIESLLHAARSGVPESLLRQAGTIAGLLQLEIRNYPKLFAKLLHTALLRGPQTKPYAEVISTEKLSAVLSTAAGTLSRTEFEGLVQAALLRTQRKAS